MNLEKAIPRPARKAGEKRDVVRTTAEKMRSRIFSEAEGRQIGSLPELAKEFGVGIVTVQQAARVLEHEGILEVKRGPGGGYYGRRPGLGDIERILRAYLRSEPASRREVLDITSLLFNRLCVIAAHSEDEAGRAKLRHVGKKIELCSDNAEIGPLETELQDTLFEMVDQPLFKLLTHVALGTAHDAGPDRLFGFERWQAGRLRIIRAILQKDPGLAAFEADRQNRQVIVELCGLEDYAT
jgi:DNA-binding FadR family transcriptional regulator